MVKPTVECLDLAKEMMDEENPLLVYIAVIIGRTMELNHQCLRNILDEYREEFEAAGVGEMFERLEARLDDLFQDFFNEGEDDS